MSREAYQVPNTAAVPIPGREPTSATDGPSIIYICGDCAAKVPLKRGDPIRCRDCGHRVLYKERTKSLRQDDSKRIGDFVKDY